MESGRQSRQRTESQRTRLADAITNGRLYQTKMVLTDFTNLNYLDEEGLSPLMRAFMIEDAKHRTRYAMVKLLIHHKADVNLRNSCGLHVLNWACKMNKFDLVKLLLEKCLHDVDLTSQDLEGNTPLIYAVINNNVDMVRFLVGFLRKFSLNVDHRNGQDKTAYLKALEMGFDECASILSQVGRASREIKVNPFLDFLNVPNVEPSTKIRVRSAPLAKEYCGIRQELKDSKQFMVKQKNLCVNDSLFDGKRVNFLRNKKRGSNLFKSRKIHSVVSQKTPDGNSKTVSNKKPKREKTQKKKATCNGRDVKILVRCEALDTTPAQNDVIGKTKRNKETPKEETNSVPKKKDHFLRVLLDEPRSQSSSVQQSPRSSVSCTSFNVLVRDQTSVLRVPTSPSSRQDDYFTQQFGENKDFPDYHSYLVWKASLDHPPNTLRSLLALRAEQRSERSSYRKGIVIPKYEPTWEDSVYDRSGGATSPVSERSGKSEAARKISAVAKTVRLSIYLTNKRKMSYRKDPDAKNTTKTMLNS